MPADVSGEESRLGVVKTYKLFIDGKFPRSESGRSLAFRLGAPDAAGDSVHVAHASRKDLREAVEAARRAQAGWADAAAMLRGQIIYRMAEMVEGRRAELERSLMCRPDEASPPAQRATRSRKRTPSPDVSGEISLAVDRLVAYAGWADKFGQVLGCNNPVTGPYYNFSIPEPTGVVAVVSPDAPALLGMVSLLAPVIVAGNTAVVIGSDANPVVGAIFAEIVATSDVPPGVVNILTGRRDELIPHIARHREIDAVHAAGIAEAQAASLHSGSAENLKRVTTRDGVAWNDRQACESPWWIEPFVELKTVWHPASA